jgi:hypothetical protein
LAISAKADLPFSEESKSTSTNFVHDPKFSIDDFAGLEHMEFDTKTREFSSVLKVAPTNASQRNQTPATKLHSLSSRREIDGR